MRQNIPEKHQLFVRFRVALVLESVRVAEWAEQVNVQASHVYHVMEGRATSERIELLMDDYVSKVFRARSVTIGGEGGQGAV